jgi:hypothetical protein
MWYAGGLRGMYTGLSMGNPEGKKPLGVPRHRREDNITRISLTQ